MGTVTAGEYQRMVQEELERKFPSSFNEGLVVIQRKDDYEVIIHRELKGDESWTYYPMFRLIENCTHRVFYDPKYNSFSLFVYPSPEDANSDYQIKLESTDAATRHRRYFEIIHHLNGKEWASHELLDDLMALMAWVDGKFDRLKAYAGSIDEAQLERYYLEHTASEAQ